MADLYSMGISRGRIYSELGYGKVRLMTERAGNVCGWSRRDQMFIETGDYKLSPLQRSGTLLTGSDLISSWDFLSPRRLRLGEKPRGATKAPLMGLLTLTSLSFPGVNAWATGKVIRPGTGQMKVNLTAIGSPPANAHHQLPGRRH